MNQNFLRFLVCFLMGTLLLSHAAPAIADTEKPWPLRPITLVVPFPAGGSIDAIGRLLGDRLSKELGQPIIISNRPGTNGSLASDAVARAVPDGYTLILTSIGTHAINPLVNPRVRYDAKRDFTHISMVAQTANVLLASLSFGGKTLEDVVAQDKIKPLNVAITGYGSSNHVAMALFRQTAHLRLNEVVYKGDAVALNDMLNGQVDLMFVNYLAALPHIKANRLRALAVTVAARSELLPDVPTMSEAGFEVAIEAWIGLAAPANLPAPIAERLSSLVRKILLTQDMQERLAAGGASVIPSIPQEATSHIAEEIAKWTKVVRAAQIVSE